MKHIFSHSQKVRLLEWATELETTPLAQGCGQLRSEQEQFCCLGIYCNFRDVSRWRVDDLQKGYLYLEKNSSRKGALPQDLKAELGLDYAQLHSRFICMNDDFGYSFSRIAQEIRSLVETGDFSEDTQERLITRALRTLSPNEKKE